MGPERTQGLYVSTRATFVMADVNVTVETLQGRLIKPLERTTTAMSTVLGLKKVVAMRKMLAEMDKSLEDARIK